MLRFRMPLCVAGTVVLDCFEQGGLVSVRVVHAPRAKAENRW